MLLARDLYRAQYDFPRSDKQPRTTLMIASVPRSGSTHFGICLWNEGIFGAPLEYLNESTNPEIVDRLSNGKMDFHYWQELRALRTTPNGVFSYKMFIANYMIFKREHPNLLPIVAADKVVYFTRGDRAAQAVSYARAIQTKSWFAAVPNANPPEYSFEAIRRQEQSIARQEEVWERIFTLTETEPYRLQYEEFLREPDRIFSEIADYVGVEQCPTACLDMPNIDRQSDALSAEWVARYRAERDAAEVQGRAA